MSGTQGLPFAYHEKMCSAFLGAFCCCAKTAPPTCVYGSPIPSVSLNPSSWHALFMLGWRFFNGTINQCHCKCAMVAAVCCGASFWAALLVPSGTVQETFFQTRDDRWSYRVRRYRCSHCPMGRTSIKRIVTSATKHWRTFPTGYTARQLKLVAVIKRLATHRLPCPGSVPLCLQRILFQLHPWEENGRGRSATIELSGSKSQSFAKFSQPFGRWWCRYISAGARRRRGDNFHGDNAWHGATPCAGGRGGSLTPHQGM